MYKNSHFRRFLPCCRNLLYQNQQVSQAPQGDIYPFPFCIFFCFYGISYKEISRKKNPACRILRLRRVATNGNSPFIAVQSCPAGLSSVLILLKYCIHQLLCIRLFRLIDNIIRLPALHHFSVIQNQHLIAEALYKCKIMADKYKG